MFPDRYSPSGHHAIRFHYGYRLVYHYCTGKECELEALARRLLIVRINKDLGLRSRLKQGHDGQALDAVPTPLRHLDRTGRHQHLTLIYR